MSSSTLIGLPTEMLFAIAEYLPVSSYTSLAVTCHSMYSRLDHRLWADKRIPMAVKRCIWNWYRDMWRCGNKAHNHVKEFDCKLRQATGARHNSDCRCLSVGKQTICRERVSGLCKVQIDLKLVDADTMEVNFWTVLTLSEKRSVIWDLRELFELPSQRGKGVDSQRDVHVII